MRKIDKLIFRAIIPPFFIALAVLTCVVFAVQIEGIITKNASFESFTSISMAILPPILIFSLPLSFLIGILIGISGLNGENQITALRACGVPVRRIIYPFFSLAIVVGFATAVISITILPQTNEKLRNMKEEAIISQVPSALQPRVFNDDLPNYVFYMEDLTADRKDWSHIFIADNTEAKTSRTILARSGTWIWLKGSDKDRLQLHLIDGAIYSTDLENPRKDQFETFPVKDFAIELAATPDRNKGKPKKAAEMSIHELWSRAHTGESSEKTEALVELNQRIALPFSVFPFALLGLALAVNAKKGGRTSGFVLSLAIVLIFYLLFINGIRLASIGKISPWIGLWAADILLGCLGIFLLIKVERSLKADSWLSMDQWKNRWEKVGTRYHLERVQSRISSFDNKLFQALSAFFRFLFPKVFDLYIAKGFLTYFFWSLITCSILFVVLTLFELLDDAIRNEIHFLKVVEYFFFYMPQIFTLAIPMAVLLGILINFGILEKNSEITAIKAGGWSLYRISIPVFLLAAGFSVCLFLIQDYVLPYTNQRQDRIWNQIKKRAPQTTVAQRKWILGESNRIYNYEYFDENRDLFVGLNIFEIDLDSARILRRIRAAQAHIVRQNEWILENGWARDYQHNGFRNFKKETFAFPEKADYFEKEIFQPKESSKMTFRELSTHIQYLMKSGYNAKELMVELYKKISFPLSCLTMTLLAIPFSFVIGKKGAFFGIGASIAIAITYQMVSSLFEALGIYGILAPVLAAWAPNIIFGAAGFWLFLSIRT